MKPLYERMRPMDLDSVIGQPSAVSTLRGLTDWHGRAFWISGASGTGKTTLARIIAEQVAPYATTELPEPSQLTADVISRAWRARDLRPLYGQAWILNEAHGCDRRQVRQLLGLTEGIPGWCTWIFTTTTQGQKDLFDKQIDAHPLLSRCTELELSVDIEAFAQHAKRVAQGAGLDGRHIGEYKILAKNCRGNLRQMFQEIESGTMKGKP